jgi:hypothetical protein
MAEHLGLRAETPLSQGLARTLSEA